MLNFGDTSRVKNVNYIASRLARTEINMAYRDAETKRWSYLDFVVGFEIKRSSVIYACPVCGQLEGKYPKDFVWNGWHPNCRCFRIPILKTRQEFEDTDKNESVNKVNDLPDNFKKWVKDNESKITDKSLVKPYFVGDNKMMINKILKEFL